MVYYPLRDEVLKQICNLKLRAIGERVATVYKVPVAFDESVPDHIVARCREVESGARNIDNILSRSMLPELSALLLSHSAEGRKITQARVGLNASTGDFTYDLG